MTKFSALGLNPILIKTVEKLGFDKPTQIQEEAIPLVLDGHDVMGLAQTGTGKTAAFGLPLVDHLLKLRKKPGPKSVHALVLVPTRELANQIDENLRRYVYGTSLKVNVVVGGAKIHVQQRKLERGTDVLIATPGRLLDLVKRRSLKLDEAQFLVLDEADQMLDLGFIHALRQIAPLLAKPRQTLLFSATMPKQMEELSRSYLNDPIRVETAPAGRAADKVAQTVYFVEQRAKSDLLVRCLSERPNDFSIVFARTKHGAEKLKNRLCDMGFSAVSVHGNKSQGQRERAIREFRSFKANIMVATDVAARGIDIPGVSHVYNFDLPEVPENYVHRIGRTARAGNEGLAIAFCSSREKHLLQGVERLMKLKVKPANANDLPVMPKMPKQNKSEQRERETNEGDFKLRNKRDDSRRDNNKGGARDRNRGDDRRDGRGGNGAAKSNGNKFDSQRAVKSGGSSKSWSENRADHRADHLMVEEAGLDNHEQKRGPKNNDRRDNGAKKDNKKQRWTASKKLAKRQLEASRTKSKKHADRRHERDAENWDDARPVDGRGYNPNKGVYDKAKSSSVPRSRNQDGFSGQKNQQSKPRRSEGGYMTRKNKDASNDNRESRGGDNGYRGSRAKDDGGNRSNGGYKGNAGNRGSRGNDGNRGNGGYKGNGNRPNSGNSQKRRPRAAV